MSNFVTTERLGEQDPRRKVDALVAAAYIAVAQGAEVKWVNGVVSKAIGNRQRDYFADQSELDAITLLVG